MTIIFGIGLLLLALAIVGYVLNVVKFVNLMMSKEQRDFERSFLIRVMGIIIPPMGFIIGYL